MLDIETIDSDQDEFEYFYEEENVTVSGDIITLTDPVLQESFDFDTLTGQITPKITVFKDCGIWINGKAAFLLMEDCYSNPELSDFRIGSVHVKITKCPPTLYLCVKDEIRHEAGLTGEEFIENSICVILENVIKDQTLEYLDKALFKLGFCEKWDTKHWPRAGNNESFRNEFFDLDKPSDPNWFSDKDFLHVHPINSFNAAKHAASPSSEFIYYYRVLEFYWDIARDEQLLEIRNLGLSNDQYLEKVKRLTRPQEKDSLGLLLSSLLDANALEELNTDVLESGSFTQKSLTQQIYDKRCSLVHAKSSRIEEIGFSERFDGELVDWDLLKCVEWLALRSIEKWGIAS